MKTSRCLVATLVCLSVVSLLLGSIHTSMAQLRTWPPKLPNYDPKTNTFTTPDNKKWVVKWYTTIADSDNYQGGFNPPSQTLDAPETVSYNFDSPYTPRTGYFGYAPSVNWLEQKNEAIQTPPLVNPYPFTWTRTILLDTGNSPYYTSTWDSKESSGIWRFVRGNIYAYGLTAGYISVMTGDSTNNKVDFVYQITGEPNATITLQVAQGYWSYVWVNVGSPAITVVSHTPDFDNYSADYSTPATYGSTDEIIIDQNDIPVANTTFALSPSGVYYLVVPASSASSAIFQSGVLGYESNQSGTDLLSAAVDTRYEVAPYNVEYPPKSGK